MNDFVATMNLKPEVIELDGSPTLTVRFGPIADIGSATSEKSVDSDVRLERANADRLFTVWLT